MTAAAPPLPREHGAWGILLQPFLAVAVLTSAWDWRLIPALCSVLLVFALREPLLVLARQRWIWRTPHAETPAAQRFLLIEAGLLAVCGFALLGPVPLPYLALLGAMAASLTAFAIWMTLRNRQRSAALQVTSALALSASAFLPAVLSGQLAFWVWPVWAMHALHATAGIFVVHARIDCLQASKKGLPTPGAPAALAAILVATAAAGALLIAGEWRYGVPLLLSAAVNTRELYALRQPETLREPFRRVGLRNLALSLLFTTLVIVLLWPLR